MSAVPGSGSDPAGSFLADVYPEALPQVYGYLRHRVPDPALAEDLAADTFVQAARALQEGSLGAVTTPWLLTVARNKLVDHWRREAAAERAFSAVAGEVPKSVDDWDVLLDRVLAHDVLGQLPAHYRAVLTLRYLDGLPVAEVANLLRRTIHATEALLVRAKVAFRRYYEDDRSQGHG